jgi:hypothetical protein
MGKRQMSKKELEELRKKEQEEAAAQVRCQGWNSMKSLTSWFMCYSQSVIFSITRIEFWPTFSI